MSDAARNNLAFSMMCGLNVALCQDLAREKEGISRETSI